MSDPQFAVDLGGGLYVDSEGNLINGVPSKIPVYKVPGNGLPVSPDAVKKALDGIAKALPNGDDPKMVAKLRKLGLDNDIINILGDIAKVAATLATIVTVVGFGVDFLRLLGVLEGNADSLKLAMDNLFQRLDQVLHQIEIQEVQTNIAAQRAKIDTTMARVQTYGAGLAVFPPDPATLSAEQLELRQSHDDTFGALDILTNLSTWNLLYDAPAYSTLWSNVSSLYYVTSTSAANPPSSQPMVQLTAALPLPQDAARFDHRMMVPVVLHELQRYLLLIKAIAPEYRSTGDFSFFLRQLAHKIDGLADAIAHGVSLGAGQYGPANLARTVYVKSAFDTYLTSFEVEEAGLFGLNPVVGPKCIRWPVGAVDLCANDNKFFQPYFPFYSTVLGYIVNNMDPPPEKAGAINFRWRPPAKLQAVPGTHPGEPVVFRITNPEECMAAANAQADADFANVLLSSGYVNLIHLAAELRHLSTEPNMSETVEGSTHSIRVPAKDMVPVTATTEDIPFTGIISSPADRQDNSCRTFASISTQPLKRQRMLNYRVVLRTLRSYTPKQHWTEPDYGAYQWVDYVADPGDPTMQQLYIHTGLALDEFELISGVSPESAQLRPGDAPLKAHTFDWYVGFKPDPRLTAKSQVAQVGLLQTLRSAGWSPRLLLPSGSHFAYTRDFTGSLGSTVVLDDAVRSISADYFLPEADPVIGERHHIDEAQVVVHYDLSWNGTDLRVTLRNRPEDRNYIIFLVVEETLVSNQKLHTAYRVNMDGQITFVPQKFLDDEHAAVAHANKVLRDFERHYSISKMPHPGDPVQRWLGATNQADLEAMQSLTQAAERYAPELLAEAIARNRVR
jgi:hypothetical protein